MDSHAIESSEIENVVVVVADSLRADTANKRMPNIQKLSENNAKYTSCYALGPHTPSSMSGIIQSRLPINGGGYGRQLPSSPPTIAEQLTTEDIACAGWHCNPHTLTERDFDRGFKVYSDLHTQPPLHNPAEQANTDGTEDEGYPLRHRIKQTADTLKIRPIVDKSAEALKRMGLLSIDPRVPAKETVDAFEMWLSKSDHDKRFFHLHFMDTHIPYKPPDAHWKYSEIDKISSRRAQVLYRKLKNDEHNLSQTELAQLRRLYEAEAEYTDQQVQRIVAILKSRDMWESSLLIFTSDHGELFGEKQAPGGASTVHPSYLCEELTHVPLIIAGGSVPSVVSSSLVSGYDLAPTIAEAFNVTLPEEWNGKPLGTGGHEYITSAVSGSPNGAVDEIDPDWLHLSVRTKDRAVLYWRNDTQTEYYLKEDGEETPDQDPEQEDYEFEMEIVRSYQDFSFDIEQGEDETAVAKDRLNNLGYISE